MRDTLFGRADPEPYATDAKSNPEPYAATDAKSNPEPYAATDAKSRHRRRPVEPNPDGLPRRLA